MDKERFLDLMKNLQTIMKCPACGAIYNVEEIQFVGNKDGYFLLSMTCSSCNLPVWVNVFSGKEGTKMISDLTVVDFELSGRGPITADEVIDFHHKMTTFNGDFKRAFGR